jgi:PemK-like, MazF-like toxin of type II toxin-antitoxin system
MNRGDVIVVRFPHPSGLRGKKRPAVVVQSDAYAGAVSTLVVAEVTKNLTLAAADQAGVTAFRGMSFPRPRRPLRFALRRKKVHRGLANGKRCI